MRGLGVVLSLILVTSLLSPLISGMAMVTFTTEDSIKVLPGDYSSGYIKVQNPSTFDYKLVSFRSYRVTDSSGNPVDFFNFSLRERNYGGWNSGDYKLLWYNVSCGAPAKPGIYTLHIRFLGTTLNGELQIVNLKVRVYVVESAVEFYYAKAYVKDRPYSPYAFNGEIIVVIANLRNLGHRTVDVDESVLVTKGGKVYFSKSDKRILKPGENVLGMDVPVGVYWPEGSYRLKYTISYGNESHDYEREFQVRLGVKVVGVSVKSTEVKKGDKNVAYMTIASERTGKVEIYVKSILGGKLVDSYRRTQVISPGSTVLQLPLPTNVTGRVSTGIRVGFLNRTVGSFFLNYTVVAPPGFLNITYEKVGGNKVKFLVEIFNPNGAVVNGSFMYRISSSGNVLYKDSSALSLGPGNNTFTLVFEVPFDKRIDYEFVLSAMGTAERKEGFLYLPKPTPTTTSTSSSTVTSPSNTTTTQEGGSSGIWKFAALVIVVLLVLIGVYLLTMEEPKKKRERPKPKRRSPLGRFKRPKPPEFRENKELPKRK